MLASGFIQTDSSINEIKIWLVWGCGIIKNALGSLVSQILTGGLCRQANDMSDKRTWQFGASDSSKQFLDNFAFSWKTYNSPVRTGMLMVLPKWTN